MSEKHIELALFVARDGRRAPRAVGLEIEGEIYGDVSRRGTTRVSALAPDATGEGTPWLQLRDEWNRSCDAAGRSEWRYLNDPSARRFSRDVRKAWERVTGQPWISPLAEDEVEVREGGAG